jgi:hypothetical protein
LLSGGKSEEDFLIEAATDKEFPTMTDATTLVIRRAPHSTRGDCERLRRCAGL